MEQINEGAVEMRVELANWPEELDQAGFGMPRYLYGKLLSSALAFSEYRKARSAHRSDPLLSPAGAHEANRLWIEERLPAIAAAVDEVRTRASEAEATLLATISAPFSTAPTDPAEIDQAQEIRTFLRSLPASDRTDRVGTLTRLGDLSALRAALTAPSYLTGLDETELAYIRDDAAKAVDPARYATLQALRKAGEAAERAVEGVARFLHQEAENPPAIEMSGPGPVAVPRDPVMSARIAARVAELEANAA